MNTKKLIAPIIITCILIIYFVFSILNIIYVPDSILIRIIGIIILLVLIGKSIFVLIERIKEIRSGEEDDLGKYWLYYRQGIGDAWTG